jgi:hypothetical protein
MDTPDAMDPLQMALIDVQECARINPIVRAETVYLVALWHGQRHYWKVCTDTAWHTRERAEEWARGQAPCWTAARIIRVELQ